MDSTKLLSRGLCLLPLCLAAGLASAQSGMSGVSGGQGKLLLTGGVTTVEGAAGGGLTPWAVTGSYATSGQIGGTGALTRVRTDDYSLTSVAVAASYGERFEVSFAHQDFDTGPVAGALAGALMDPGFNGLRLKQDIVGLKARIAGDAILDSDNWMPQIAVGLEYKKAKPGHLAAALQAFGAKDSGTDIYVSATKLFLAQGILVNGTLRATKANQTGLLGFGAAGHDSYQIKPEISVAYLLSSSVAIGAEYRAKPDNFRDNTALGAGTLKEDRWMDIFLAWTPNKHASLTLAYVDLGKIVPGVVTRKQTGSYVSAQLAF
ncbi:MAG: DUF3034 family protein [Burkholderiales bacterium]|nr:MAG: DUF3034 family protein [Burkholderiales bacterium]